MPPTSDVLFRLISGSANCVVSGFSAAGISAEKKQTAFPLLMFPIHAQSDLSAIDKHSAVFHKFAKLDAGADAQVHLRSVYALAF